MSREIRNLLGAVLLIGGGVAGLYDLISPRTCAAAMVAGALLLLTSMRPHNHS